MSTIFYGALVTPTSLTSYLALPHALLVVSKSSGVIEWLEEDVAPDELQDVLAKHGILNTGEYSVDFELVEYSKDNTPDTLKVIEFLDSALEKHGAGSVVYVSPCSFLSALLTKILWLSFRSGQCGGPQNQRRSGRP